MSMEVRKLSKEEIKALTLQQSQEVEVELRLGMTKLKMDVYTDKATNLSRVRQLKRDLARVLTFRKANILKGS